MKKWLNTIFILLLILFNIDTIYCMNTEFYFDGNIYNSFDAMIYAKKRILFESLSSYDSQHRASNELKFLFYERFGSTQHNTKIYFNEFLNQFNSREDIVEFSRLYIDYL